MNRMERAENQINVQAYVRNLIFQLRHSQILNLAMMFFKIFVNGLRLVIIGFTEVSSHVFFSFRDRPLYDFCTVQFNPQGPPTLG